MSPTTREDAEQPSKAGITTYQVGAICVGAGNLSRLNKTLTLPRLLPYGAVA